MGYSKDAGDKIERDLALRLAGYEARIEAGKGLLASEWDDVDRLVRHFAQKAVRAHIKSED